MPRTFSDQREPASSASPTKRRLAAQHVREARDRLTSTSGTRPFFDYELLRQFAQNRLSGSLVILILIVTIGVLSSLWTGALTSGVWTGGALVIHLIIVRNCRQFPRGDRRAPPICGRGGCASSSSICSSAWRGPSSWSTRSGSASRPHLHAVRDAAVGRHFEHAGLERAGRGVRADACRSPARSRSTSRSRARCTITFSPSWRWRRRAIFRCWRTGSIRPRSRRSRPAPKRTR